MRNVPEGCTEQPTSVWLGREALPAPLTAELQGLREGRKPRGVEVSGGDPGTPESNRHPAVPFLSKILHL